MSEKKSGNVSRGRRDRSDKKKAMVVRAATAWHPPLYDLVTGGAPPTTEVRTEIELEGYDELVKRLLSTLNPTSCCGTTSPRTL